MGPPPQGLLVRAGLVGAVLPAKHKKAFYCISFKNNKDLGKLDAKKKKHISLVVGMGVEEKQKRDVSWFLMRDMIMDFLLLKYY